MVSQQLLTIAEVAERLSLSDQQVRKLAKRGEIPVFRIGPRGTRIRQADMEKWIGDPECGGDA